MICCHWNRWRQSMIIYKRELDADDLDNLNREEELIYYKSDEIAITINIVKDSFIVRKKRISDNELLQESFFKTIREVIAFIND